MEYKLASLFVAFLVKAFKGRLHLYMENRWARHIANGNSQASVHIQSKILWYNSLFHEWRINMANKKRIATILPGTLRRVDSALILKHNGHWLELWLAGHSKKGSVHWKGRPKWECTG